MSKFKDLIEEWDKFMEFVDENNQYCEEQFYIDPTMEGFMNYLKNGKL